MNAPPVARLVLVRVVRTAHQLLSTHRLSLTDLSPATFETFAPLAQGEIPITWEYV